MKGETTLDERIHDRLKWLDRVFKFYVEHFPGLNAPEWAENLVSELIADAAYLAAYHGVDLETIMEETVKDIRFHFPDVPG